MTTRPTASTINDAQLDDLHEQMEQLEAAITRVRTLHVARPNGTCAARCYSEGMAPEPWPCPTIRALDTPAKDSP